MEDEYIIKVITQCCRYCRSNTKIHIYLDSAKHDIAEIMSSEKFYGLKWEGVSNSEGGLFKVTMNLERVDEDRAMEFMKRLKDAVKSGEVESVTIESFPDLIGYGFIK